jgi:dephospho-CoA kinase
VLEKPAALVELEALVHPLVAEEEARFLAEAAADGHRLTLSDIPLLFETGADQRYDFTVVVTAPEDVRRARALERPGMTDALYASLLARQMPDAEKRRRAHFIVDSARGMEAARRAVADIVRATAPLAARR